MLEPPCASGLRVLLVGINYAPEHTGIAPYTSQACEHLAALGADVFVLAGVPHYPHWTLPAEYRGRWRSHEQHGGVRVRRLRHFVPATQSARTRSVYEASFGLHVAAQRVAWRPDVVVSVVPSLLGAAGAAVLARRTGAPLVLWVQDLMGPATAQSGIAGGEAISSATGAAEKLILRRAASVVVVSEPFRRYAVGTGVDPDRVFLVPNWTHVAASNGTRGATRRRLGWGDDEIIALHSGNMGLKQGLENVVAAARQAPSGMRFVLMGDGNQRAYLESQSHGVGRLQLLPPATAGDFPSVLAAADVLLVNERASAVDMSLPSKLTSYFSAGVPVVAAVPAGGGTAGEVLRSGAGRLIPPESPAALVSAVVELGADPALRARMGTSGVAHARDHLSREVSLAKLVKVIGDAAGRSSPTAVNTRCVASG